MKEDITVFTPTFNRAHTLKRTYDSLRRQTVFNFVWLIVDDGSTDDTEALVRSWIDSDSNPFSIRYVYKQNGGLHTGYNTAIANIDTELCICCDSDDYLPDNAIEIIRTTWAKKPSGAYAGIIGLDFDSKTHTPIGGYFSSTQIPAHFLELESKFGHTGDTKMVLRTELLKPHIPMPTFKGEKNFNPIYLFMKVDPNLNYILVNENLCNVEYQDSGMSANIFCQFRNSPRSFAEIRKAKLSHPKVKFSRKIIDAAHLTSCAIFAGDWRVLRSSGSKLLVALTFPLGIAINVYVRYKTRKL